jgi:hypothetical protein
MSRSNAREGFSDGWCSGIMKIENFIFDPLSPEKLGFKISLEKL